MAEGGAPWHLSQSVGDTKLAVPQAGVAFSKWQLTLEQVPNGLGGTEVWLKNVPRL